MTTKKQKQGLVTPEFPKLSSEQIQEASQILRKARLTALRAVPYYASGLLSMQLKVTNDACYPIAKLDENGKPVELKDPVTGKKLSKPGNCVHETEDAWYVGTAMVDKHYRTYVHPEALKSWIEEAKAVSDKNPCPTCGRKSHQPYSYVAGILVHEMCHPLRKHHDRAKKFERYVDPKGQEFPFQRDIYNIAIDLEINDNIQYTSKHMEAEENYFCLPGWVCMAEAYKDVPGMKADLLAETYYQLFLDDPNKKINKKRSGAPSCGSGADGEERECDEGGDENDPNFDGITKAQGDVISRQAAEDIKAYAQKYPGKMPGGLVQWADLALGPPKVHWRQKLNKMVRYLTNRASVGSGANTYNKLSRVSTILNYKVILPSTLKPLPRVAIVRDTSGSMMGTGIKECMNEIDSILKTLRCHVSLIDCDTDAVAKKIKRTTQAAKIEGCGGTDIRVGLENALKLKDRPDVCIVLTDGVSPWHTEDDRRRFKGMEVLVVICGDYTSTEDMPSWYRILHAQDT